MFSTPVLSTIKLGIFVVQKRIKFVTTNNGKFEEVARWLHELEPSLVLEQASLDIPEIQSLDAAAIGIQKARSAWQLLQEPLLIDDGGIYLTRFHNFPGPLTKYVYEGLGIDGFWLLAQQDPRCYFLNVFVYKDSRDRHEIFEGKCSGIVQNPTQVSIDGHVQLPFTKLLIPEGSTKTLAQLRGTEEEKKYHHRFYALKDFVAWLKKQGESI
jgi:XTP/dITP diphosphohydrolase